MTTSDFKVGDKVVFGRNNGEQTHGTVIKVNPRKLKVRQDEIRGTIKAHQVGTVWTVPPNLLRHEGTATHLNVSVKQPSSVLASGWKTGDKVAFDTKGTTVVGYVKRVNPKTISVQPEGGGSRYWRVSPKFLRVA